MTTLFDIEFVSNDDTQDEVERAFTWDLVSIEGNTITMQVNFDDASAISKNGVKDSLKITIRTDELGDLYEFGAPLPII